MKKLNCLFAAALFAGSAFAGSASAADVGVSISIGEPGFYGTIDIGDAPPPRLIYSEPRVVVVEPGHPAPLYLRVRSGYASNWAAHCREYYACNRPVYFVRDDWYESDYVPYYRGKHKHGHEDNGHGKGRGQKNKH